MTGIRLGFTLTLFFLLTAGMVSTTLVTTALWHRLVLGVEAGQVRERVAFFSLALGAAGTTEPREGAPAIEGAFFETGECLIIVPDTAAARFLGPNCDVMAGIEGEVQRILDDGVPKGGLVGGLRQTVWSIPEYVLAVQVMADTEAGKGRTALGLARSLAEVKATTRNIYLLVLITIVLVGCLLTVIWYFRFDRQVIRPINRLISLTEQHDIDEGQILLSVHSRNEFSRLAVSLSSMLRRIDTDKQKLRASLHELAESNRQLKQSQESLIRTEKLAAVGRLTAGIAHEIGNPLAIINGYHDLLLKDRQLSDQSQDFLQRAAAELQRVNRLIRQLLDFSRSETGHLSELHLHAVIKDAVSLLDGYPEIDTITIDCVQRADEDTVYADRDRLVQVILNCLLNSVDAVLRKYPEGSGSIRISTIGGRNGSEDGGNQDTIEILIEDNGIGLSEELQKNVFDPFFTTKPPGQGTGLGLSVSLAMVQASGGRMRFSSIEGEGSRVVISLPRIDAKGS